MFRLSKFFNFFKKNKKNKENKEKEIIIQKISLKDPTLYKTKILNYVDYKKNLERYTNLTKRLSKFIIKKKFLVSVDSAEELNPKKYAIEIRNLSKYFLIEDKVIPFFSNFNLKIEYGDFLVILGPSGSGKTTLLNIMSGLDKPESGDVVVNGYNLSFLNNRHLTEFRRMNIGLIFQNYNLLQNLTARENVEIAANLLPEHKKPIDIDEIFSILEIKELSNLFVYQLSGGQQQRFSIARALSKNPCILFCDEPTGSLDEKTSNKAIKTLLEINKKYKTTIILITHNESIPKIAKTIVRLKDSKIVSIIKNPNPNLNIKLKKQ